MDHPEIWRAIDTLAAEHGLSPSGLARNAGLDPTAFNPSKRISPDGRPRWPSTESIAKVLRTTDTALDAFVALVTGQAPLSSTSRAAAGRQLPMMPLESAAADGLFDSSGLPLDAGWKETPQPGTADPHAYALEVTGNSLEPVFRSGTLLLVSPAAPVRRGDRVVLRTTNGDLLVMQVARRGANRIELKTLNPEHDDRSFALSDVAWVHRIIWASQ